MLSQFTPIATLPTADLSKARKFYGDTLGLTLQREAMDGLSYQCGDGTLFVYQSDYAGTNKATAVTFEVPTSAFDTEVDALRGEGVSFLTFELEGVSWDNNGIASMGDLKAVWFTDPDGNIINVSAGDM
jgi:catechol 2,3-dioxygenase-like lactoylglutathione lyase family enzyme